MKIQLIHITEQNYTFKDEVKKGYRAVFYYPDIRGGFAETFRVTSAVYEELIDKAYDEFGVMNYLEFDSKQLRYNAYGVVAKIETCEN